MWPGSTKALTVEDIGRGGTLHLKLAQENETLQIWLEEAATKRQFYASLTGEECKAIVKDTLDPSNLLEMLHVALSAGGEAVDGLSGSFEWCAGSVTLILHLAPCKWMAKSFQFALAEREVSQVDRLERRVDDMDTAIKHQEVKTEEAKSAAASCMDDLRAEIQDLKAQVQNHASAAQKQVDDLRVVLAAQIQEQAQASQERVDALKAELAAQVENQARAELNAWALTVHNPFYDQNREGESGHFAFSGNWRLVEDTDFQQKHTGVATKSDQEGRIVATFAKPTRVSSVKLAVKKSGNIAKDDSLRIETLSPGNSDYQILRANIPSVTQEETFPINKEILSLRLVGTYIRISKLIFS